MKTVYNIYENSVYISTYVISVVDAISACLSCLSKQGVFKLYIYVLHTGTRTWST